MKRRKKRQKTKGYTEVYALHLFLTVNAIYILYLFGSFAIMLHIDYYTERDQGWVE